MRVPGHKGIQQNETANRLAREGGRTKALENPSTDIRHLLSWFVNVNKWESRFLKLNTAKNTDFTKKYLKYKLRRTKFPTKNTVDTHVYPPPQEWSLGTPKIGTFEIL